MRSFRIATLLAIAAVSSGLSCAAWASPPGTLEFDATSGTPITTIEIDEQSFRFALDPLLGPYVTINPDASERIEVRSLKADAISAKIDGAEIKGSLARVRIKANGRSQTVNAALIARDHLPAGEAQPYDLAGGFEALPANTIIVHLNRAVEGPTREIVFSRSRADPRAGFPVRIADTPMRINVHFANPSTWLDRRAAEVLINEGLLKPSGEVSQIPVWYGLQMPVQRMEMVKRITLKGIQLDRLQARTKDPLILPDPDENVIIVRDLRQTRSEPLLLLGVETLSACAKIVFDQRRKRLTFTCPA